MVDKTQMQSNRNIRRFIIESHNRLCSWYLTNKHTPPLFKRLGLDFTRNNIELIVDSIIYDRPEFICQPTVEDMPDAMRVYMMQKKAILGER